MIPRAWLVVLSVALLVAASSSSSFSHQSDRWLRRRRRRRHQDNDGFDRYESERVEAIADQLAHDIGLGGGSEDRPNIKTANMSISEYWRAQRLYEMALERSELLQEAWREHRMNQQQQEEKEVGKGDGKVRRMMPAKLTPNQAHYGRIKRDTGDNSDASQRLRITIPSYNKWEEEEEDLYVRHAVVAVPVEVVTAAEYPSSQGAVLVLRHLLDDGEGGVVVDRKEVRAEQLMAGGRYEEGRVEMDATQAADGWMLLERGREELWLEVECRGCAQAGIKLITNRMEEDEMMEIEADVGMAATEARRFKRSLGRTGGSDDVTNMLLNARHQGEKKRRRRQRRRRRIECPQSPPISHGGRTRKPRCCRSPKELVFGDFGDAFQFLLKPHTMEVGMCGGRCPAKYAAKNAHALLQSLLHLQSRKRRRKSDRRREDDQDKVPAPCCVPTKLSPRPVLHLTSDGDAEVSWWRNVVADECGCS